MREACQCQVIFDSERSMTKTEKKPSELANALFDAGYSVDEVAEEFRDRYEVYEEEKGE